MTRKRKEQLLGRAYELALERATIFRVARRTKTGELLTGHRLYPVGGERRKRNLIEKGARPVLPSSEWRSIYQEVGL